MRLDNTDTIQKPPYLFNEVRVLILGQTASGKTQLFNKLVSKSKKNDNINSSKKSIHVKKVVFKDVDDELILHIWDFEKETIVNRAFNFFLSQSVVFVIVRSEREQSNINDWLDIAAQWGKNSPVLIVQNQMYGYYEDIEILPDVRKRFKTLETVSLDLSENNSHKEFLKLVKEVKHLANRLPQFGKQYHTSFNEVKKALQVIANDRKGIEWQAFEKLCNKYGIDKVEIIREYARELYQLGICLWIEDDLELGDYLFLQPAFIVDALSELISEKNSHLIRIQDIRRIWCEPKYNGLHSKLLKLMKHFRMCYEIHTVPPQYIVPQLLPNFSEAIPKPSSIGVKLIIGYEVLFNDTLARLACHLYYRIDNSQIWKDAVKFKSPNGATVLVVENRTKTTIELIAEGNGKLHLLTEVLNTLVDINEDMGILESQEKIKVLCSCDKCKENSLPHEFGFYYLSRKLYKGAIKAECRNLLEDVYIKDVFKETHPFSFNQIRRHIEKGQIDAALDLLESHYIKEDKITLLVSQLNILKGGIIKGIYTREEQNADYQKISANIILMISQLEKEYNHFYL